MEKCFLCDGKNYIITDSGADIEIINGNRLEIDYNNYDTPCINIEINFCPMCGRKLENTREKGYKLAR